MLITAAFDVLYGHMLGSPRMPDVEAVATIAEPGRMTRAAARTPSTTATDVDLDAAVEGLHRQVEQRARRRDARVEDRAVEATEVVGGRRHGGVVVIGVGDVAGDDHDRVVALRPGEVGGREVRGDDPGTLADGLLDARPADTRCGAGDPDDMSVVQSTHGGDATRPGSPHRAPRGPLVGALEQMRARAVGSAKPSRRAWDRTSIDIGTSGANSAGKPSGVEAALAGRAPVVEGVDDDARGVSQPAGSAGPSHHWA